MELSELPALKTLQQGFIALGEAHNGLAKAVSQNAQAFGDAFTMVDMQIHILQRVMDDLVKGEAVCKHEGKANGTEPPISGVDWIHYQRYYWRCIELEYFFKWLNSLPMPAEAVSVEDEAVVFGG